MSKLPEQVKKVFRSPGSPKKLPKAKVTREEAARIRKEEREQLIQRSHSNLTSIQAQSSEADEHLLYLDPQDQGEPLPDLGYPIREVEEEEQYSYFAAPEHIEPPTTLFATMSLINPPTGTSSSSATPVASGSRTGTGVSVAIQAAINAAIAQAGLPQQQANNGKNY